LSPVPAALDKTIETLFAYRPIGKSKAGPRASKALETCTLCSAEMFAGCGGLALGMSRAGFKHAVLAELDASAVQTVEHNRARGLEHVSSWPVEKTDVREIDWRALAGKLAVISGGPPCQPFGIGGKKKGHKDDRDMWPEAIRAIREAKPDGFLFENVRNLAGPKFKTYLDWIANSLRRPSLKREEGETHLQHLARLQNATRKEEYSVEWQVVNAADYGAPQIRFRVLIFGMAARLGAAPRLMTATHSRDRLLWDQYVTGEYWTRHGLKRRPAPESGPDAARVEDLQEQSQPPQGLPWVTTRDALKGLGAPNGKSNHLLQPGARAYPGHTGSPLDMPAKALKAGDHGVPGGENMMVEDGGSVRYFTVREAARLVGLPDDYLFPASWSESMRQLGNAVPAQLAEAAGGWLKNLIVTAKAS
jgi:DNA (cytosine-5)-methyltransferase 1